MDVAVSKINTKAESSVNNNSYIKDIIVFQTKAIENIRNQLANIKNGNDTHNENPMKDLITAQNKSIEFLRDELASTDKIYEKLMFKCAILTPVFLEAFRFVRVSSREFPILISGLGLSLNNPIF